MIDCEISIPAKMNQSDAAFSFDTILSYPRIGGIERCQRCKPTNREVHVRRVSSRQSVAAAKRQKRVERSMRRFLVWATLSQASRRATRPALQHP